MSKINKIEANATMASSSSSAVASFDSLPDELALKILKMATWEQEWEMEE